MLRFLIRGYLLRRLLGGGARHRRHRGWMAPRHRGSIWMAPRHRRGYHVRPRARTNVRVGGCCLPVPLGMLTALLAGGQAARRARR